MPRRSWGGDARVSLAGIRILFAGRLSREPPPSFCARGGERSSRGGPGA